MSAIFLRGLLTSTGYFFAGVTIAIIHNKYWSTPIEENRTNNDDKKDKET